MARSIRSSSRPAGRLFVLLVMAVLAGVLGMHGLPEVTPTAQPRTGHEMAAASADRAPHAGGGCAHPEGGSSHLDHADATCAAAGTGSAYSPPALAGDVLDAPTASSPAAAALGSPRHGRAPPDLSELQLLRI
ncbi:DUF6153 family protein [Streptomyces sp. BB1-1-1]|uniref:DUF6153 family protein n=1 Tax=Streptomyces sp. BB1-1-1 TaxID=3074430 RepID=UPI002877F2FA|nr:DUF6153 family protein [Streptomyces sp. BB1-1-1]WND36177.1 DUF6153 family protein [Streptomyces sp. BB1-1-1]